MEGALDLDRINTKTVSFRMSDHEAKILPIPLRHELVPADNMVWRLQGQHRTAVLQHKNAMHESATLHPCHSPSTGTGRQYVEWD